MDSSYEAEMNQEPTPVIATCLGLQLDIGADPIGTPIEVIIVAKVIRDGEFNYQLLSTSDLQTVEAIGMMRWGQLLLEEGIMARSREEEEEGTNDD